MSEGNEDKQEEPTERRKEQASQKGEVVYSREVSAGVSLLVQIGTLIMLSGALFLSARFFVIGSLSSLRPWPSDQVPIHNTFIPLLTPGVIYISIFLLASHLSSLIGHVMQKGFESRPEAATPDVAKIDPIKGIKKLFSAETIVNVTKNLIKTLGLLYVSYLSVSPNINVLVMAAQFPILEALTIYAGIFSRLIIHCLIFLTVVAVLDYFVNYKMLMKKLMMSRQELKDEMKDTDGNPQIKQKVKQIQQKRARREIEREVPKATMVVMNPTHYAVVIYYKRGETPIPRVTAKGVDGLALKVREIAKNNKVPVIENPPLARALYRDVKVGKEIPSKFYKAVAKIIALILKLEEQKKRKRTESLAVGIPSFMR